MLDSSLLEQLTSVFTKLENEVEIVYYKSAHKKQSELLEMLNEIESTSVNIRLTENPDSREYPEFFLKTEGSANGVSFVGIPGGHEFTSLILAILNADGKGKVPDEQTVSRIKNLQGPIKLKTFISLTCENCPEVVQALNLMAIYHNDFEHQMVDGEFQQDEINRLNIQGVPSVIKDDTLLISGKNNLGEILTKLEKHYGSKKELTVTDLGNFDVVVIGGGPAGASAAIYTARKGLKTALVATRLGGQLQETKGIENLISVPYTEGPELSAKLESHIREYEITVLEHRLVETVVDGLEKTLTFNTGEFLNSKAVIIATGAKWRHLNVPGENDYIGRGVAFCAHCDGPYYKGKDIAVVGGGNSGVEAAIDLAGIVKSIVLLEHNSELKADKTLVDKLNKLSNVTILTNVKTKAVQGDGAKVIGIEYEDRLTQENKLVPLDGVFVQIGLVPNTEFLNGIVELNRYGEIVIDSKCKTSAPGIYAAGDVTNVPYKQIVVSLGEGAKAALTCFEDLVLK